MGKDSDQSKKKKGKESADEEMHRLVEVSTSCCKVIFSRVVVYGQHSFELDELMK